MISRAISGAAYYTYLLRKRRAQEPAVKVTSVVAMSCEESDEPVSRNLTHSTIFPAGTQPHEMKEEIEEHDHNNKNDLKMIKAEVKRLGLELKRLQDKQLGMPVRRFK